MITINVARDGRSMYGFRRYYRITLESSVGTLNFRNRTRRNAWSELENITQKLITEERPFKITGITKL